MTIGFGSELPVTSATLDGEAAPIVAATLNDDVNHPKHYQRGGVECIDVVEGMGFLRGNAMKYLWRAGQKDASADGEIQDLEKARWYISREIENLKAGGRS